MADSRIDILPALRTTVEGIFVGFSPVALVEKGLDLVMAKFEEAAAQPEWLYAGRATAMAAQRLPAIAVLRMSGRSLLAHLPASVSFAPSIAETSAGPFRARGGFIFKRSSAAFMLHRRLTGSL